MKTWISKMLVIILYELGRIHESVHTLVFLVNLYHNNILENNLTKEKECRTRSDIKESFTRKSITVSLFVYIMKYVLMAKHMRIEIVYTNKDKSLSVNEVFNLEDLTMSTLDTNVKEKVATWIETKSTKMTINKFESEVEKHLEGIESLKVTVSIFSTPIDAEKQTLIGISEQYFSEEEEHEQNPTRSN